MTDSSKDNISVKTIQAPCD